MPIAQDLADLQDALNGRDTQIALRRHLGIIANLLRDLVNRADDRLDALEATVPVGDARLTALEAAVTAGAQRLTVLEAVNPLTMTVVANLAALPATAGVRQWFRVQGDTTVYVGNGAAQPLTKVVTSSLP